MVTLAALTLGGFAHADGNKTDKCRRLQLQYDNADKSYIAAKTLSKADQNRKSGGDLCAKGKREAGIEDLKAALTKIGIKPAK
ncbi:MAG: hypothetical protein HC809_11460 [Gammaproteobacteria bacterium]|nr:hypothetical protein [Gammaproteobacteria bacterium]